MRLMLRLMLKTVGRVVRSNGRIDADLEPESINIYYFEVHKNTAKTLLYGYLFGGPPPKTGRWYSLLFFLDFGNYFGSLK